MAWRIELTASARKQLKKMGQAQAKHLRDYLRYRIEPLNHPRQLGQPLTGNLAGLWRYRVDHYRVVCELRDDTLLVLVLRLGHRGAVYR